MSTPLQSTRMFTAPATKMERYGSNLSKIIDRMSHQQQHMESPELIMSRETSPLYRPPVAIQEQSPPRPALAAPPLRASDSNSVPSRSMFELATGKKSLQTKKPLKKKKEEESEDEEEEEEEEEEDDESSPDGDDDDDDEDSNNPIHEYQPSESSSSSLGIVDKSLDVSIDTQPVTLDELKECSGIIVANGLPQNGSKCFAIERPPNTGTVVKKRKQAPPASPEDEKRPTKKKRVTKDRDDDAAAPETINSLWRRLIKLDLSQDQENNNIRRLTAAIDLGSEAFRCAVHTTTTLVDELLTHARTHKPLNDAFLTCDAIDADAHDLMCEALVTMG